MPSNPIVVAVLAAGVGAAACIDLRTRRVPNALTLSLALAGVGCAITGVSGLNLKASLIGFAVGMALMLPGYLIGATGAGDVKLLAAAGTLIGPAYVAMAFLYTALAGGVLALLVARRRRRLSITLERASRLVVSRAANLDEIEHPRANNRFAYAPAIAVGSMLAALGV
jgi:prepilin peptidase CpaA